MIKALLGKSADDMLASCFYASFTNSRARWVQASAIALLMASCLLGQSVFPPPSGGGGSWGSITGTLSAQSDLNAALGLKAPLASPTFTGTVTVGTTLSAGGTALTSSVLTGTTTANAASSIVGVGTLFLTQTMVGGRITLSSDPSTYCTITKITDNTHLELDSENWGDSCGDGTLQTITFYPIAMRIRGVSGLPMMIGNDIGQLAIGNTPANGLSGQAAVPYPDSWIYANQAFTATQTKWLNLNVGTLPTDATNYGSLYLFYKAPFHAGTGTIAHLWSDYSVLAVGPTAGAVAEASSYVSGFTNFSANPVPNLYGFWAHAPNCGINCSGTGAATNGFGFYADAVGGTSVNPYSFWSDERGVYRIKADNTFDSVYQAIPALYNPQFTKYTPGLANYERIVEQWNGNVAEIGTEKGGTGTLRNLRLIGTQVLVSSLKTTGAATGKTVVCVDVSTGQLYASSSGVACAN